MAFKGTKGEWTIQDDFRSPKIINESSRILFTHDSDCYDTDEESHNYYSHNKMMANAKLIAAAPELLEALKEMVRMYESIQPSGGWQGQYEMSVSAIEKALK